MCALGVGSFTCECGGCASMCCGSCNAFIGLCPLQYLMSCAGGNGNGSVHRARAASNNDGGHGQGPVATSSTRNDASPSLSLSSDDVSNEDSDGSDLGNATRSEFINLDDVLQGALQGVVGEGDIEGCIGSLRMLTVDDVLGVVRLPHGSNTKKREYNLKRCWAWYEDFCRLKGTRVEAWPPPFDFWSEFVTNVRAGTPSRDAFYQLVMGVSTYGSRLYGGRQLAKEYGSAYGRLMRMLNRHYGSVVRQVRYIDATEARNFHKFVDRECLLGLTSGAAFAFGVTGGGKRPRSVTSILLDHVTVVVEQVVVRGKPMLVPAFSICIVDEKYSDCMGPRAVREWLAGIEGYEDWAELTCSWWLYRCLVVRNAFTVRDPMAAHGLRVGDHLPFRDDATHWFLFCYVRGDLYENCRPLSTGMLFTMTSKLLERMGSEGRGYSAHRKGCVTRAVERELLLNGGGQRLVDSLTNVLVRWGGWDVMRGQDTLSRRYVQQVVDRLIDTLGLGLGKEMSEAERQVKLLEMEGVELPWPSRRNIQERSVKDRPLLVRMMAYMDPAFQALQRQVDEAGKSIRAIGFADKNISLLARDQDLSTLFCTVLKSHSTSAAVLHYGALIKVQRTMYKKALMVAERHVLQAFHQCSVVSIGSPRLLKSVFKTLAPYCFGGDPMSVPAEGACVSPDEQPHPAFEVQFVKERLKRLQSRLERLRDE